MSEYLGCLGLDVLISMARWDFWIRVLEKISIDHEHGFLFSNCVNDVILRLVRDMDMWKRVWFWKIENINFVFMRNVDKTLMILWFVFWKCFDSSIKWFWEQKDGSYAFEMKKIGN